MPPFLGTMNPYGGEGPPRTRQGTDASWWTTLQQLQTYVATYGFPNQKARRGQERTLAIWWMHQCSQDRYVKLDQKQRDAVDSMKAQAPASVTLTTDTWDQKWSNFESWVLSAGRLPKRNAADNVEKEHAKWLNNQRTFGHRLTDA